MGDVIRGWLLRAIQLLMEKSVPADIDICNVATLGDPLGQYSHIARVKDAKETVYIAGMLSANKEGESIGVGDIDAQLAQVFGNLRAALEALGMRWDNIAQFTTYLTDAAYIPPFMQWRLKHFPAMFKDNRYPPNTLLIVKRLVREEFLVEVQSVAVK